MDGNKSSNPGRFAAIRQQLRAEAARTGLAGTAAPIRADSAAAAALLADSAAIAARSEAAWRASWPVKGQEPRGRFADQMEILRMAALHKKVEAAKNNTSELRNIYKATYKEYVEQSRRLSAASNEKQNNEAIKLMEAEKRLRSVGHAYNFAKRRDEEKLKEQEIIAKAIKNHESQKALTALSTVQTIAVKNPGLAPLIEKQANSTAEKIKKIMAAYNKPSTTNPFAGSRGGSRRRTVVVVAGHTNTKQPPYNETSDKRFHSRAYFRHISVDGRPRRHTLLCHEIYRTQFIGLSASSG